MSLENRVGTRPRVVAATHREVATRRLPISASHSPRRVMLLRRALKRPRVRVRVDPECGDARPGTVTVTVTAPSRRDVTLSSAPPPLNEVQVPLISRNLRAQLFPPPDSAYAPRPPSPEAIRVSRAHLQHHGLLSAPGTDKPLDAAIEFKLPDLQGPTISHHFHAIGHSVAEPYLSMAKRFAAKDVVAKPDLDRFELLQGWTHYSPDGSWEAVAGGPPASDETIVFDVETLPYQGGVWPILAVAAGETGWYAWCSPWLTGDDDHPNHLIPFDRRVEAEPDADPDPASTSTSTSTLFEPASATARLVIGHNVLYDRARVESEYSLRRPATRYLDTLSLHVAVSGLTNPQRPTWIKYRKTLDAREARVREQEAAAEESSLSPLEETIKAKKARSRRTNPANDDEAATTTTTATKLEPKTWKEVSSLNSLAEVARLHCGVKVDKELRSVLIDPATTIEDVRRHFSELVDYCARDVAVTWDVYRALLPKFLASCPHPATFAGVCLMSQPVLPVDRKWPQYLERAEATYQSRLGAVQASLNALAHDAKRRFDEARPDARGRYDWEDDVWLKQLDWTPKRARRLPDDEPSKRRTKTALAKAVADAAAAADQVATTTSPESTRPTLASRPVHAVVEAPRWTTRLDKLSLQHPFAPLLFRATYRSHPVVWSDSLGWLFAVPAAKSAKKFVALAGETRVDLAALDPVKDVRVVEIATGTPQVDLFTVPPKRGSPRVATLVTTQHAKKVADGVLASPYEEFELAMTVRKKDEGGDVHKRVLDKLRDLAREAMAANKAQRNRSIWLRQLDWEPVEVGPSTPTPMPTTTRKYKDSDLIWPKWYWDLDVPGHGLDVSIGKRAAPLLLRLKWKGFPIAHSKQHGWSYRIPRAEWDAAVRADPSLAPLAFSDVADMHLGEDADASYVKLPHPDGEGKNVGSPLSKPFVAAFEDGVLTSEYPAAEAALALNASCSYWTSARERILNQMVVWDGGAKAVAPTPAAIASDAADASTRGLILPQVIPMGTITRRAVERTWLTASNAKKNRVGSELKSMVQAPPGYAIVGADVDSEELWICSVMGDAQFGIHGATAIGWMTLEGTKAAGTDLHSKSASILGISRDDAKVFNYSRIYGAGVKHAVQLLVKANPALSTERATELAKNLYASTKGVVDRSAAFKRNFWHGGTESFVFNKLEEIAQNERPRTPALGCGLTAALTKAYLPADGRSKAGEGYLPSRINWVVQSSGVDYLHLLLVSMEYLTKRFEIDARYLISVHDEIRYLVKDEDKYRAAMALQIANVWTRSLFAYRLQMPDLPQGCAFFSAVDVDTCFRKEVNMTCVTPSNPDAIAFGESQEIAQTLARTAHGSLFADGRDMANEAAVLPRVPVPPMPAGMDDATAIVGDRHRVDEVEFLVAQTASKPSEIANLWKRSIENARRKRVAAAASLAKDKKKKNPNHDAAGPPLEKIRSIRFVGEEDERHDGDDGGSSRASRPVARTTLDDDSDDDFDDDDCGDVVEGNYSVHLPLHRRHV